MAEYSAKKVKDVRPGDVVMFHDTPAFTVKSRPEWVGGSPETKTGHVLVEGRTKLGRKVSGQVYAWHHTVLCLSRK